jgi:sugar/nucleoside kinase (ribokinase family)
MSRYASWGIIIDDIIFPDGRSSMGLLGGAGLYAAIGMRLWTPDAMLISAVGEDFDRDALRPHGLDDSGLFYTGLPTPRAWQLFEEDGRRTQIFRVPEDEWQAQLVLGPSPQTLPATLEGAHYLGRGDVREEAMTRALRAAGVRLCAEPVINHVLEPEEEATLRRCIAHYELFSPDMNEAVLLVGERPIIEQLRAIADLGPRVVALRRGAAGSVVYERDADRFWRVPAAPARVVDVTGAGNAFCGGLLVGWCETGDLRRAAAYAAVSAAITIEQDGPPLIDEGVMADAGRRAEAILPQIRPINPATLNADEPAGS